MKSKRGQASMEYLVVIAITFMVLLPILYLFFSYSKQSEEEVGYQVLYDVGKTIVNNAASIYYSGAGSKTTLSVKMPANIREVYILDNRELIFNVTTTLGYNEVMYISNVPLYIQTPCPTIKCTIPLLETAGQKNIRLEANETVVVIYQVT